MVVPRGRGRRRRARTGSRSTDGGRRECAGRRADANARQYPRTARLNQLVREIVAEALEQIDDERLELRDRDRRRGRARPAPRRSCTTTRCRARPATTRCSRRSARSGKRLQAAIGREARIKRTPELAFRPDPAVREGDRIETILAEIGPLRRRSRCPTIDRPTRRDPTTTGDDGRRRPTTRRGRWTTTRDRARRGPSSSATAWPWSTRTPGGPRHDVVAKARGILHNKKIGHSGTLDPDATGVLLLGVGRATRLLRFLTVLPKSYVGEIVLGVETDHARRPAARWWRPTTWRRSPSSRCAPPRPAPDRRRSCRCRRWCRRSRSAASACTSWPAQGDRGRARPPPGDRPPVRPRRRCRTSPACCRAEVELLVGHLRAHAWPTTSATPWAAGPTCATCAAPPSARSPLADAHPLDEIVVLPTGRGRARLRLGRRSTDDGGRAVGHGKVLERSTLASAAEGGRRSDGPWAVLGPDGRAAGRVRGPSRARRSSRRWSWRPAGDG